MQIAPRDAALPPFPDTLLTVREVAGFCRCGVATVWRRVKAGGLPQPVYLGPKSPRWWRSAVEESARNAGKPAR